MKTLFEVTIVGFKNLYIEAANEEEALEIADEPCVADETDWEHDKTRAEEMDERSATVIRERHPGKIVT